MKTLQLSVQGQVQGVGFRPEVYRLARDLSLVGQVCNNRTGVEILLQGARAQLDAFVEQLPARLTSLAVIRSLQTRWLEAEAFSDFRILASAAGNDKPALVIPPDTRPCSQCLAEMSDPDNRRWRYPFINCTACGPRYSLIHQLPYDRPYTSMAAFELCSSCADEYADPGNRRFHAQPNACPDCGPQLWCADAEGQRLEGDPLALAWSALQQGQILAVKGVSGFHLLCAADQTAAVERLRARKQRPDKPLAVMALNTASLEPLVELDQEARQLLQSPAAPLLLLPARSSAQEHLAWQQLAPGMRDLGVLLPSSPLHWLLFHEALGRPRGEDWMQQASPHYWVATSANLSGQPLVADNDQALQQLAAIADLWLLHDRDIVTAQDDPVIQAAARPFALVRPGRGGAPLHLPLAEVPCQEGILALGGFLKTSSCLIRQGEACLSQYIGDLDQAATCERLEASVEQLCNLLDTRPRLVCSDLHPDFYSSRLAERLAREAQIPWLQVQHHHAHVAAVMAEYGLHQEVLGLVLDGHGLGEDGQARGGEVLSVTTQGFTRLGALAPLSLPGGDAAAREPWRLAAAVLQQLGENDRLEQQFAREPHFQVLLKVLQRPGLCPVTTSGGRLFDAAAGLLGICTHQAYEAQAALLLEAAAATVSLPISPPRLWTLQQGELSFWPLLAELAGWTGSREEGAALFHAVLVDGLSEWLVQMAGKTGLQQLVLTGGCFFNALLRGQLIASLEARGLQVYFPSRVSPGDAGLSLGQAWVAQWALQEDESRLHERLSYVPGRAGSH
ncbi:carbamoyltransferase HypF [Marinospirillum perlucidum]|uniref:carbamoyltransferase HypF n=1 Tax=Marinospirillum perlucidum TaxID=1982602 RepID=UPI000DF49C92|nr:carbamoyltransferase HypF [Marinospirillum perlucidum]